MSNLNLFSECEGIYMLKVFDLTKKYHKVIAVDNVSFNVEKGSVTVLLGPNGAGKSTIIKSVTGLLRYKGSILVNGLDNKSIEAKKCLSYVPEVPAMFPLLNVREHLIYFLKAYEKEIDEEKINNLLERFDLSDKQDKLGNELSKGMMQKVSICCALIVDPDLIILDEPMVGLDPKAIKELKNVVLDLRENNKTVLISTHMLEMVESLWDHVILMNSGKLLGNYAKDEMGDKDLEHLYFENTGVDHE